MLTTTEFILFITVWSLTGIGLFFGFRGKLRKRRRSTTNRSQGLQKIRGAGLTGLRNLFGLYLFPVEIG